MCLVLYQGRARCSVSLGKRSGERTVVTCLPRLGRESGELMDRSLGFRPCVEESVPVCRRWCYMSLAGWSRDECPSHQSLDQLRNRGSSQPSSASRRSGRPVHEWGWWQGRLSLAHGSTWNDYICKKMQISNLFSKNNVNFESYFRKIKMEISNGLSTVYETQSVLGK